jgi:hypothetical protein
MPSLRFAIALCLTSFTIPATAADPTVSLPPGETPLIDIGIQQVGWQSYGKEPVAMPRGWDGHFEHRSGISYTDWGQIYGRRVVMMHPPWHVPTGKTWADYPLALPSSGPIRLSFGIAMGPDAETAAKGDGVTFSCYLTVDGRQQELMHQHCTEPKWKDYQFDLSPHAGKKVVLRLQVEPGPKNDASFDFGMFGDAKITVGTAVVDRAALVRQLVNSRAYRATEKVSLAALSNRSQQGIVPSNLLPCTNACERSGEAFRFLYQGDDCRVVYTYKPASGTLDDFTVQVDNGPIFGPALGGGATVSLKRGDKSEEVALRGGQPVKTVAGKSALSVLWQYDVEGRPLQVAWDFKLVGKALKVSARCDQPLVTRFSLGQVGGAPLRRSFAVPYLVGRAVYFPGQNLFGCRYLDWTQSHASSCPQGDAVYETKTDGARNPLVESGYIAVSPQLGEVLPNLPSPPSPYRALLGPRIMLDMWRHHDGTYQGDGENLRTLKDNGVDHVAIIQHVWQRWGYDVKLPDHLPANPEFGGDVGMIAFGKAANGCGYVWSVHENYIDLYPDAPSYDATARVLLSDGSPSKAWFNSGTQVQSYGLKCNRALEFARRVAPEAHRRYGTTAAYLDVHTCVPPWHQLDHEAGQPMAAMALAKVKFDTELFQFMRDAHHGPLFGEGCNQFYWAGRCDGVEAQVYGGEDHPALLDFDLLKIHPQMVNHGMGYYERWFRGGYRHRWGHDTGTVEQIDKYRAQELAYGHAGFVGEAQIDNIPWVVREHHLVHPVQRLYGTAKPVEIRYEVGGRLVDAGIAMAVEDTMRQYVRYESGLRLWINWRAEPWRVEGRTLPQWGFLALGPGTQVSTSLRDGRWSDYAECPEYVFADARTWFPMPYLHPAKNIEPRLRSFKYLGDNRAEVTYEWIVGDTLETDYHCFVHGLSKTSDQAEQIVFQQDHYPAKPTSQWRKGETIVDGPYVIGIPAKENAYDLAIGLYKERRVLLLGEKDATDRILIAHLALERQGDKITKITAEKVTPAAHPKDPHKADFAARLNPPGTWIDFGAVATDSSVKINREPKQLVLFPYPRDKVFRVTLDMKALAPAADLSALKVHALAAGTCKDLGPANFRWKGGRLVLTVGKPGAGRYVIAWK